MIGAWIVGSGTTRKPELAPCPRPASRSCRVAREPRRLPAFRDELVERRIEARRRRASAACSATASSSPCTSTGRAGRARATSNCPRSFSSTLRRANTKPMPGGPSTHLPDAAISASNGVVRASIGKRAERAHRIDDEALAVARDDGGDLGQRIQDAGRRLAMDEPDMRDRRVRREQAVDVLRRRRHVVGGLERATAGAPSSPSASRAACRTRR